MWMNYLNHLKVPPRCKLAGSWNYKSEPRHKSRNSGVACGKQAKGLSLLLLCQLCMTCSLVSAMAIHDWRNQRMKGKNAPFVYPLNILTILQFDEWTWRYSSDCLACVTCSPKRWASSPTSKPVFAADLLWFLCCCEKLFWSQPYFISKI